MDTASSPMMRLEGRIPFLLLEHAQAAQQRQAGIHQRGQLAGEGGQDLGLYPAAQAGDLDVEVDVEPLALLLGLRFGRRAGLLVALLLDLLDLDDLGREQAHFLDPADGLVLAGDLERALGLLAMGVHRHVVVFWHRGNLSTQVYLTTSSIVVSPSKMLRKPSSRSVTMPSSTAFWRITTVGARSLIRARMASLMVSNSKMPLRPL